MWDNLVWWFMQSPPTQANGVQFPKLAEDNGSWQTGSTSQMRM